jgi:hypothetical protein
MSTTRVKRTEIDEGLENALDFGLRDALSSVCLWP